MAVRILAFTKDNIKKGLKLYHQYLMGEKKKFKTEELLYPVDPYQTIAHLLAKIKNGKGEPVLIDYLKEVPPNVAFLILKHGRVNEDGRVWSVAHELALSGFFFPKKWKLTKSLSKIKDEMGYTPFHVLAYKYPKEFLKVYPFEKNRDVYEVEDAFGNTVAHVIALREAGFPFENDKELLMKTNNFFVSLAELGILLYNKKFNDPELLRVPAGLITGITLKELQELKASAVASLN